jgi:hypothetical protein
LTGNDGLSWLTHHKPSFYDGFHHVMTGSDGLVHFYYRILYVTTRHDPVTAVIFSRD